MPYSNNRELITLVKAIGAGGDHIKPIVILKAATIIKKQCIDLPDKYILNTSKTGYLNDQISLKQLQHFINRVHNKRRGNQILLLINSYKSYITYKFVKLAYDNKIQLFALLPYTSYTLQPLDVGCF